MLWITFPGYSSPWQQSHGNWLYYICIQGVEGDECVCWDHFLLFEQFRVLTKPISYCPFAMRRYHEQVTLKRKAFIGALFTVFRCLVHDHHSWEPGNREAWCWNNSWELTSFPQDSEGEKGRVDQALTFEIPTCTPSDTSKKSRP